MPKHVSFQFVTWILFAEPSRQRKSLLSKININNKITIKLNALSADVEISTTDIRKEKINATKVMVNMINIIVMHKIIPI